MSETILTDTVPVSSTRRRTSDGYLIADCKIARAENVQIYSGREAGMPSRDKVRIYRPEAAVMDAATLRGWAFRPVTMGHPQSGTVDAENWREETVGFSGNEIVRDGEFVSLSLGLMDAAAISQVEDGGLSEISCGYRVALDWEPGTTPKGEPYDAKVTKVVPNHLAIVPKGRAGSECRIGDSANGTPTPTNLQPVNGGARTMGENTDRAVILVDGFTVETTPQGREAIQRLQTQLNDARAETDKVKSERQSLLDSLNGQLAAARQALTDETGKKEGEVAALKFTHQQALDAANAKVAELEQRNTPEALEAMAAARAATVAVAKRVFGDAFTGQGMSDAEIRKQSVIKATSQTLNDAANRDGAFYDSVFEVLAAEAAKQPAIQQAAQPPRHDPMRMALATNPGPVALDATKQEPSPLEKSIARLTNAYRHAPANGVI